MNQYIIIILLLSILISPMISLAQDSNTATTKARINGVVKDNEGMTIPSAHIILDGTTIGTSSDMEGKFSLVVPVGKVSLTISMTGYEAQTITKEVVANGDITVEVNLKPSNTMLNELVIVGGRFEQSVSEQVTSIEVLQPDMIDNANLVSIDQAVEKVPGVNVIDGQANIRGGSGYSYGAGSRVALLVDGLPALLTDSAFPQWDFLPVENLAQVEVLKGAASALYGSSALNGIINFRTAYATNEPFTKVTLFGNVVDKPRDNVVYIEQNDVVVDTAYKAWWAGETPPYEAGLALAHRQRFGNLDFVIGANLYDKKSWIQDNYNRRGRINTSLRYRSQKVPGLNFGVNVNGQRGASTLFFIWDGATDGAYRAWETVETPENSTYRLTVDPFVEYYNEASNIRHKLLGRFYYNQSDNQTNQSNQSNNYYGEYQFQKQFPDNDFTVTAGLVGAYSVINAELYGNNQHFASNVATYLQLDKKFFGKLNMSFGGRYEMNYTEGVENIFDEDNQLIGQDTMTIREAKPVFRFGLNYELTDYTFLRLSWGQGYRYPSVAEKFVQTNLGDLLRILPNPGLESETGYTAEIGIKQGLQIGEWQGFVDVSGFLNRYFNMMEFNFGNFGNGNIGFRSQNVGDTRILGGEITLAGQGKLFGLPTTLLAGYTYIDPIYSNFDDDIAYASSVDYNVLKYRYKHTAKGDIESQYKKLSIGGAINYRSYMEAIDNIFNALIPGAQDFREVHNTGDATLDLRLSYQLFKTGKLSFLCKNVFNREYALRPAIIESPRNYTIKYTHQLN